MLRVMYAWMVLVAVGVSTVYGERCNARGFVAPGPRTYLGPSVGSFEQRRKDTTLLYTTSSFRSKSPPAQCGETLFKDHAEVVRRAASDHADVHRIREVELQYVTPGTHGEPPYSTAAPITYRSSLDGETSKHHRASPDESLFS